MKDTQRHAEQAGTTCAGEKPAAVLGSPITGWFSAIFAGNIQTRGGYGSDGVGTYFLKKIKNKNLFLSSCSMLIHTAVRARARGPGSASSQMRDAPSLGLSQSATVTRTWCQSPL